MISYFHTIFFLKTIWPYLRNSLLVGAVVVLITLSAGLPAAYSISRFRARATGVLFTALLFFRMIPYIALIIPIFFMLNRYGLLGTRVGLSLAHLVYTIPFAVWLMKGFFDLLPVEMEQAALIDGCSRPGVFWRITLPLARPGMAVTALFVFLFSYVEYLFAVILTREPSYTLPVRAAAYMTIHDTYWRLMACAALISLVPMIIIFGFLQKHLVRGLTLGAVK